MQVGSFDLALSRRHDDKDTCDSKALLTDHWEAISLRRTSMVSHESSKTTSFAMHNHTRVSLMSINCSVTDKKNATDHCDYIVHQHYH